MPTPDRSPAGPASAALIPTLTVLAGSLVALVGTLAVRAVMARALDPAGFGLLITAIATVTVAGGVANFGVNPAAALRVANGLRQGDAAAASRAARTALAFGAGTGLAAGLVVFAGADVLAAWFAHLPADRSHLARTLRVLVPVSVLMPLGGAALGVYRGHGRVAARALIRDGGGGLARAAGVATAAALGGTSVGLGTGYSAGMALAEGGFVVEVVRRGWLRRGRGEELLDGDLVRGLPPYASIEVLAQGRMWLDLLVLGVLAPPAVVGIYGLARGLARGLEVVYQAGVHRYLPALGAEGIATRRDLADRTRRMVLALLLVPMAVGLMAPALPVLLLAGDPYRSAAPVLQVLTLAIVIDALFGYQDQGLLVLGRGSTVARIDLAAVLAYFGLLAALIPPLGASGAAWALVGTTALRALALAACLHRDGLAGWPPARRALPAVGCLAIGTAAVVATEPSRLPATMIALAAGGLSLLVLAPTRE